MKLSHGRYNLLCRITQIPCGLQGWEIRCGVFEDLSACLDIGAFESYDQWDGESDGFGGVDDALGDDVAAHDASEDVDEDAVDGGVGEDDAEGFGDGFFGRGTADIEEVCGFAVEELDGVHGCHRESGAVDEASDVSVECDVGHAVLGGFDFCGVFFGGVGECLEVFVAEGCVVIEVELGVDGDDLAVGVGVVWWGDDEGVDLGE